jgi:hypothetical protein
VTAWWRDLARTPLNPFVRLFSQAPAVAPTRKVTTKLSAVNRFIIGMKQSGAGKVPPHDYPLARHPPPPRLGALGRQRVEPLGQRGKRGAAAGACS